MFESVSNDCSLAQFTKVLLRKNFTRLPTVNPSQVAMSKIVSKGFLGHRLDVGFTCVAASVAGAAALLRSIEAADRQFRTQALKSRYHFTDERRLVAGVLGGMGQRTVPRLESDAGGHIGLGNCDPAKSNLASTRIF